MKLSEQHLLDGNNINNGGFDGGCVPEAYKYIYQDQCGISLAKDYSYAASSCSIKKDEEVCINKKCIIFAHHDRNFTYKSVLYLQAELVPLTGYGPVVEEHELKKAVSKRAVAAAIQIYPDWTDYAGVRFPMFSCLVISIEGEKNIFNTLLFCFREL